MQTGYCRTETLLLTLIALLTANLCAQRDRRPSFTPPDTVGHTRDIPYAGTDNPRQRLDLLLPKEPKSTLISVTGGGHGEGFGREVDREVERFFDHHLRGATGEWRDQTIDAQPPRRPHPAAPPQAPH